MKKAITPQLMKKLNRTPILMTVVAAISSLLSQHVNAQCSSLDFPFTQFSANDNIDVVYNMFAIDSIDFSARSTDPTFDVIACGYTDDATTQLPLITKLQASNGYEALWSYQIGYASNKQCNDVSYAGDGSCALFVIDDVATDNPKIVHLGLVTNLLAQSASPTITTMTLTSGDNANAAVFVGINFAKIEDANTAYLILRASDFTDNGLNFLKINPTAGTVLVHQRGNANDFPSEVISIVTGENPVTSLFMSGWMEESDKGALQRNIWVWKADSSALNPSVSFQHLITEAGWTAIVGASDLTARFYPEHMAYETGFIYVGASLVKSTAIVATETPVLLFYLDSSNLLNPGNEFFFLKITNQQIKLKGYNIVETGKMSVFVQATDQPGYYMNIDLTPSVTERVTNIKKVSFFEASFATVTYSFFFSLPDGTQTFMYAGFGTSNICNSLQTAKTKSYAFVNVLDEDFCPCLYDLDAGIDTSFTYTLDPYAISSDVSNPNGYNIANAFVDVAITAKTSTITALTTPTWTDLKLSVNFGQQSRLCSIDNFVNPAEINCACVNVETSTVNSPVLTFDSDFVGVQTVNVGLFTMAVDVCRDQEPTNPFLTCFTDSTYTVTQACVYETVNEANGNFVVSIGDAELTYTNANSGTRYVRLTATSGYGASGFVDFNFIVNTVAEVCDEAYTGANFCPDPCLYNYDPEGSEVCSPCSDTFADGPNASSGQVCGACDVGYVGEDVCNPCTARYELSEQAFGDLPCSGCFEGSQIYPSCDPCDAAYLISGFGTDLCDPCSILYEGELPCTPCWPEYSGPEAECSPCDYGYAELEFVPVDATCTACSVGYTGSLQCTPCDENYADAFPEDLNPICSPCDDGYTGSDPCTPCTLRYSGTDDCNACYPDAEGFNVDPCSPCFEPEYTDWLSLTGNSREECTPCSEGYSGSLQCTACYVGYVGEENCEPCDDGYTAYAAANYGGVGDCTPCTIRYDGSAECNQCYPGSEDYGLVTCGPCDAGYSYFVDLNDIERESCSPCEAGYNGPLTCSPCDVGYSGAQECLPCTDRSPLASLCFDPCSDNYVGSKECFRPFAPYFFYEKGKPILFETIKGFYNTVESPEVIMYRGTEPDDEGDSWKLTCAGDYVNDLIEIQQNGSTATIISNIPAEQWYRGIFNLICTLEDVKNGKLTDKSLKRTYMLIVVVRQPEDPEDDDVVDPSKITGSFGGWEPPKPVPKPQPKPEVEPEEVEKPPENVYSSIYDFDRQGLCTIKFSRQLKPFDLLTINGDTVIIRVNTVTGIYHNYENGETPEQFWALQQRLRKSSLNFSRRLQTFSLLDKDYEESAYDEDVADWGEKLNFTWYPVDFTDSDTLKIHIDFEYPVNVSLRDFKDSISVNFTETAMFVEWGENTTLVPSGYTMVKVLPSQLSRETGTDFLKFLERLFTTTLVISIIYFVFKFVVGASVEHLWTFIHTMQIYTHFLLFNLKFSANAHTLLLRFLGFTRIGVIPALDIVERMFGIERNSGLNSVFNEADYDSVNVAYTLSYFNTSLMIVCFILFVIWMSAIFLNWLTKKKHDYARKAAWQTSHRILLLGLIELILCPVIFLLSGQPLWFSIILSLASAAAVIYLFVRMIQVLCIRRKDQTDPDFYLKFSSFFSILHRKTVSWQSDWANLYYFVFFFRRVCFILIIFMLTGHPAQQLQLTMVLSVLQIGYLGYVKPIVDFWHLCVEIIDEFIVLMICYMMLQFSDYYPDSNTKARYIVGTTVNALVVFHIIYHLGIMVADMIATIYRMVRFLLCKKEGDVVRITKHVPKRSNADLFYPFDVTEFSVDGKNKVDPILAAEEERKFKKKSKTPQKKLSDTIAKTLYQAEWHLSPHGHPSHVDKTKKTEKPETIDEFSYEETIGEDEIEEEIIVEERVILADPDGEPMSMNLERFVEPMPCSLDGQKEPVIDEIAPLPSVDNKPVDDLAHLNAYRTDSRYGIREVQPADNVPKVNESTIDFNAVKTLDVDLFSATEGAKYYESDESDDLDAAQTAAWTIQTSQTRKKKKPEDPNTSAAQLIPQALRDEIYQQMVEKTKQRLEQSRKKKEQEKQRKAEDEDDGDLNKDMGKGIGGHRFFRAIATSLQRKGQFAAIKAARSNNTFDRVTTNIFVAGPQPADDVTVQADAESSAVKLKRFNTKKIQQVKISETILKDNLTKDVFLDGMFGPSDYVIERESQLPPEISKRNLRQSQVIAPSHRTELRNPNHSQDLLGSVGSSRGTGRYAEDSNVLMEEIAKSDMNKTDGIPKKKQKKFVDKKQQSMDTSMYSNEVKRLLSQTFGKAWSAVRHQ